MVSNFNLGRAGRIGLIWTFAIRSITKEKDDILHDVIVGSGAAISTAFILQPSFSFSATGWGIRNSWTAARYLLLNPYAQAVYIPYAVGLGLAAKIDGVRGVTNYLGFTTLGYFGEDDIHYFSGDANDSGYFNVGRNVQIIVQNADSRIDDYIVDRYEEAKARFYKQVGDLKFDPSAF